MTTLFLRAALCCLYPTHAMQVASAWAKPGPGRQVDEASFSNFLVFSPIRLGQGLPLPESLGRLGCPEMYPSLLLYEPSAKRKSPTASKQSKRGSREVSPLLGGLVWVPRVAGYARYLPG